MQKTRVVCYDELTEVLTGVLTSFLNQLLFSTNITIKKTKKLMKIVTSTEPTVDCTDEIR